MWKLSLAVLAVLMVVSFSSSGSIDGCLFSFSSARGEEIATEGLMVMDFPEPLTLVQCIEIALQRSSDMKTSAFDMQSADLNVKDARARYFPEVNSSAQYRFSDQIDPGWEPENYDLQVGASYLIWDHGHRKASLAQAKVSKKSLQIDYERVKQDLVFSIIEGYYNFLQAEKLIDVNLKALEISKGNVDKVNAFLEAGSAIPAEVASARVQQANDELALINAQNNLELARARLASLMGLNPNTPIRLQGDPDYETYVEKGLVTSEVSLENAVVEALQKRPELLGQQIRLTSLEWSLKVAKWDRWPILTAECDYNIFLASLLRERDAYKNHNSWSAAARVTFPIFDAGVSKRRQQNAEIAIEQANEDISARKRSIALEVQQTYLSLERSRKSLEISVQQVKNATENLNVTMGRYEQNIVIFLEVLSAQAQYTQALTNRVNAFYNYKVAEESLQKATGTLQVEGR